MDSAIGVARYVLPITNGGGFQDVALKLRQLLRGPRFLSFLGLEGCLEKIDCGLGSRYLESMS